MKTVWKFTIKIEDEQIVMMPPRAEIIHVGLDPSGQPCVWAKAERSRNPVERLLFLTGTGSDVPDAATRHLGSFNHGPFVWHVWEPSP